jgi:hypothetical protein
MAPLASTGCAAQNRETFMRESAGDYVYRRPLPEVFAAAKALLAEDGFTGREEQGSANFITEWKGDGGESSVSARFTRYLVRGQALGPSKSIVRFFIIQRSRSSSAGGISDPQGSTHTGMSSLGGGAAEGEGGPAPQSSQEGIGQKAAISSNGQRDLTMEWRLLQKVEPAHAKKIEADAYRQYP